MNNRTAESIIILNRVVLGLSVTPGMVQAIIDMNNIYIGTHSDSYDRDDRSIVQINDGLIVGLIEV